MPLSDSMLVIDDYEVARRIPVQLELDSVGPKRSGNERCRACQGELEERLITTYSTPVWEDWPLAIDGWLCRGCSNLQLPRFLEPEEAQQLSQEGAEAAQAGHFREAELAFRRVANSWPRYAPGRLNLAMAMQSWLNREEQEGEAEPSLCERLANEVERQLRDALQADALPTRLQPLSGLINALLRRNDTGTALGFLQDELKRPDAPRAELEELRVWIEERGDLYQRGVNLIEPHIVLHDRPSAALSPAVKRRVEQGIALLERHVAVCKENWAALWLAGKGSQRLGREQHAVDFFQRSLELKPDQPDVARECALALMRMGAYAEAVQVARHGCGAAPEDAGLRANLALAHLLGGELDAALEAAQAAVRMDGEDEINRNVLELVQEVHEGRRKPPGSAAELGI